MRNRLYLPFAVLLTVATPATGQSTAPTLKTHAAPLADALGEKVATTWRVWNEQWKVALAKLKGAVGDVEEPELGKDLTTVPPDYPSNFDTAGLIRTGADLFPGTAKPDVVGAFRFICRAGPILRDDPIVFPGQPGKSHLHQFFGNTGANAYSTYRTLRTTGESTCMNKLNRSAYWIPAMLNGKGKVVRPDFIAIYYKRLPEDDPRCTTMGKACVNLPRGLRFLFGFDMQYGTPPTGYLNFNCQGPGAIGGNYKTITAVAVNCPVGAQLGAILEAPQCWDGKHLDSANHRSHVGYPSYWKNDGVLRCPENMPYVIPAFTLSSWYTVDEDLDRSGKWVEGKTQTWSFSSDDMTAMGMGRYEPGTTFHGDWFGAWDEPTLKRAMDNCINKLLSCSDGILGDGGQLVEVNNPPKVATPHTVAIPAI